MKSPSVQKVAWREPTWSYRPQVRLAFNSVLGFGSLVRILLASGLATAAIAACAHANLPNLQFNWLGGLAWGIAGISVYMAVIYFTHLLIPPSVTMNRKGVTIAHGQSVRRFKWAEISAVHLVIHSERRIALWISTERFSRRVGVPLAASFRDLAAIIGDRLAVERVNLAQERYKRLHERGADYAPS